MSLCTNAQAVNAVNSRSHLWTTANTLFVILTGRRHSCHLVTYLILNHRRPLCAQQLDCLEHVDDALVTHSLQHNTESYEDASPTDTGAKSHTHTHPPCFVH